MRGFVFAPVWLLLASCSGGGALPLPRVEEPELLGGAQLRRLAPPPLGAVELCFNAVDDNQDGRLDEGCDLPESSIQIALSWQSASDHFDLIVADPEGQIATTSGPTALGFVLDRDCPHDDECAEQPYESVVVESDERVSGWVHVAVRATRLDPETSDRRATLGIKDPSGSRSFEVQFTGASREARIRFQVVAAPTSPAADAAAGASVDNVGNASPPDTGNASPAADRVDEADPAAAAP